MNENYLTILITAFLAPIITGLVVQLFIKKWAKDLNNRRLSARLALISLEIINNQTQLANTIHTKSTANNFPLADTIWRDTRSKLYDLDTGTLMIIDSYYRQINLLNDTYRTNTAITNACELSSITIAMESGADIVSKILIKGSGVQPPENCQSNDPE